MELMETWFEYLLNIWWLNIFIGRLHVCQCVIFFWNSILNQPINFFLHIYLPKIKVLMLNHDSYLRHFMIKYFWYDQILSWKVYLKGSFLCMYGMLHFMYALTWHTHTLIFYAYTVYTCKCFVLHLNTVTDSLVYNYFFSKLYQVGLFIF